MHQLLLPGGSAGPTLAVRDDVISALVLLMLSAPATPEERGHAPTEVVPSRFRFGLSAGVGLGPRSADIAGELWAVGELTPFLEVDLGRVKLRWGLALRVGSYGLDRFTALYIGGVEAQVRFHFTDHFAMGAGVEVSGAMLIVPDPTFVIWQLGPNLTVASVRLGQHLNHELSLSATLLLQPSVGTSGFAFLRYAFLF